MTYFPYDPEIKPTDVDWPDNFNIGLRPYITGTTVNLGETKFFDFIRISKDVAVRNNGGTSGRTINVAIEQIGLTNGRYITLDDGDSFSWEMPLTGVYVSGSAGGATRVEVVASLTQISASAYPTLSASLLKYKGHL